MTSVDSVSEALKNGILTLRENGSIHCIVCDVTVTGDIPAAAHISGSKHCKLFLRRACFGTVADATFKETAFTKELETLVQQNILKRLTGGQSDVGYRCLVCESGDMFGEVLVRSHIAGAPHKKKLSNCITLDDKFSSLYVSSVSTTEVSELESFARNHILSSTDKSADEAAQLVRKALSENVLRSQSLNSYECIVCNVSKMMGCMSAASHLQGSKHLKMLRESKIRALGKDLSKDSNCKDSSRLLNIFQQIQNVEEDHDTSLAQGARKTTVCTRELTSLPTSLKAEISGASSDDEIVLITVNDNIEANLREIMKKIA